MMEACANPLTLGSSFRACHPAILRRKHCLRNPRSGGASKARALEFIDYGDASTHAPGLGVNVPDDLYVMASTHHHLTIVNPVGDVADISPPVYYLAVLVGLLAGGAYLVVRQALIRRELDEAAKSLGESIRSGKGSSEDYFELGAVLIRKKLFTQAVKNLEKSIALWNGNESDLAQVYNALGFCYFNTGRVEDSVKEYSKAVKLQPGYTTAWNNLGDAHEDLQNYKEAYNAYKTTLSCAPENKIAQQRAEYLKGKIARLQL